MRPGTEFSQFLRVSYLLLTVRSFSNLSNEILKETSGNEPITDISWAFAMAVSL